MALSLIAQPDKHHPAFNPVVYAVSSSASALLPGFRFVYEVFAAGSLSPFATFRVAPVLPSSGGYLDISKILQNKITNTLNFDSVTTLASSGESHFKYDVKISEEYAYYWNFVDYEDWYGYWVTLTTPTYSGSTNPSLIEPLYNVGDLIEINLTEVFGDNRDLLAGFHTVVAAPELVEVTPGNYAWKLQIDIPFADIGSGGTTPSAVTYFSDRRKWDSIPGNTYPETPVEIVDRIAYNEAVPFAEFPTWDEYKILPTNDEEPLGDILTNSPNWFETQKDKDKYTIKTYQSLYWNAMNNPANDDETILANTMIVQNEFGDKWMLVDYNTFQDTGIKMRQFDVSPDNQNWINITPSFSNTLGYQYGINPYTHITPTGELRESRYLDYWTTFAPGVDDCDEILLFIELDPTAPGPPTEDYYFTARPVNRGFNGRRIYQTIIDDKYAVIWSDIISPTVRNWKITFTNGNPEQAATQYLPFATRTSNSLPFGQSYAVSNSVDAWKAFDGNPTTFYQTTDGSGTATITYNFSSGAIRWADIQSYKLDKGGALVNAPTAWRVEASQNGSTWTVIHTVTGNLTNATYYSPQLYGTTKYNYVRLVVTGAFAPPTGPTNVRIFEFSINSSATVATMISGSNCPTTTPFTPWTWNGPNPPVGMDATIIETFANGPFTFPTLKRRRVYLDYDCEINSTQILFLDRAGSYSSFNFPLRRLESGNSNKLSYKNEIGFISDGQWNYNTYDSENTVYNSSVEKTYTLTTDWLTTGMSDYFEELITSPEVYIKLNSQTDYGRDGDGQPSQWLACNVIDSAFVNPKQKNKRLINRTITVKLNSNNAINI